MPLLIPIIVGTCAFLLGLGAGTVARGEGGVEFDLDDAKDKRVSVVLKSGGKREGTFSQLHDDWLVLQMDEGEFLNVPLKKIKQVFIYA